jgi:hypothetical protein
MNKDELNRLLSDDEIIPTAGFTASVMDAVRREAAMPPPISFPWKRALPGLAVAALTLFLVLFVPGTGIVRGPATTSSAWTTALGPSLEALVHVGGLWAIAALLLSFLCVKISMNFSMRGL